MKQSPALLLALALFLIPAHRLPAPIQEIQESPTPAPEQSAKPKPKRSVKPKVTSESSTEQQTPSPTPKTQATKHPRFAGTWNGALDGRGWVIVIDANETHVTASGGPWGVLQGATRINGDTLQATLPTGWPVPITFSLTPDLDGTTARVRLQGFLIDSTAVFHRTAAESSPAKPAR